jgi:uncharacterized protein YsxB (DUF464 family)
MTNAVFYSRCDGCIFGFCLDGHTTDDGSVNGKIVCAAVSSAAYMAANTITDIIGDKADISVSDGHMSLRLDNVSDQSVTVLKGLLLHLREMQKQYKSNIKVNLEVQPDA